MTEFYVLRNQPMVPDYSFGSFVLLFFVMFFCIGLGEELLFRAMLQGRVQGKLGPAAAILVSSLLFGMMHSGYANPVYMVYVFFVSLVFGYLYYRTNSLLLITVVHGTINFFLFSIVPYLYG
jgi:membrane protease YdiL (CAAX protease family)